MRRWTPPPKLTISEWANTFRKLSAESSAEPGDYSTDKAPYQKGVMDAVSDRYTERVVFMAGSQLGKSEIENNIAGFFMDPNGEPSPILIVQPTIQMAEDYSKDRIFPMIRDTPVLKRLFNLKSRSGDNTLLHKRFPGGNISLIGANSPASLASKPKRVLLADEIDRFPRSAGDEGDPFTLAVRRTATFLNRKIIAVSTPTIKGHSRIEALYEESDKRRFKMPCPHCKEKIAFQFGRLNWDKDANGNYDPKTVRYLCQNCDAVIDETEKFDMLRQGEWIAEKPFTGTAGFHLNELYSPWRKWSEIVKDFLEAKKSPHTLKAWINTSLGETFEERGEAPEYAIVYQRREDYEAQVPAGVIFLTAGVDVQKDRLEIQIMGWGKNKERWVIDNRVIPGNTQFDDPWEKLDDIMTENFEHESGNQLMIRTLGIDSGFLTQRVYDWARKYPANRVLVLKGVEHQQSVISTPKAMDVKRDGKRVRRGMKVWTVGTDIAKSELYGLLKSPMPTDEELRARGGQFPSGFIHFPKTDFCDENYFKQLTAEALIPRTVRGFTKYVWVKIYERNEALDTYVYNRAVASFIGIDRFTDKQWDSLASASFLTIPGKKKQPPPKKTISEAQSEAQPKQTKTKKSSWLGR